MFRARDPARFVRTSIARRRAKRKPADLHSAGPRIIIRLIRRKYGKDDSVMKKVLLLGDSIRIGYDDYLKELIEGKCDVIYDPDDN